MFSINPTLRYKQGYIVLQIAQISLFFQYFIVFLIYRLHIFYGCHIVKIYFSVFRIISCLNNIPNRGTIHIHNDIVS